MSVCLFKDIWHKDYQLNHGCRINKFSEHVVAWAVDHVQVDLFIGKTESVALTALVSWASLLDLRVSRLPSTVCRTGCPQSLFPPPHNPSSLPESFPSLVIFPFHRGENEPAERALLCKYKATLLTWFIIRNMTVRLNTVAGALHADVKIGLYAPDSASVICHLKCWVASSGFVNIIAHMHCEYAIGDL